MPRALFAFGRSRLHVTSKTGLMDILESLSQERTDTQSTAMDTEEYTEVDYVTSQGGDISNRFDDG